MDPNSIFQALTAVAVAIFGWLLKRVFTVLDRHAEKVGKLEVEVSGLMVKNADINRRLDSIESKIDKLLERGI